MKLPGTWLLAQAERLLDPRLVASIIVPTIADLQHEVEGAGPGLPNRIWAFTVGYAAIARLLVVDGLIWRLPMRRMLVIVLLGALGAGLFLAAASGDHTTISGIAAMVAVAVLTPLVLRRTDPTCSYRRAFANCFAIGMVMVTTSWAWALVSSGSVGRVPWYAYVLTIAFLMTCVGFGSALAAAAAWQPEKESLVRRRAMQVVAAAGLFVVAYLVEYFSLYTRVWDRRVLFTASVALFIGLFFAAVVTAVYLPVLLGVRRVASLATARALLTVLGACLFPVPLLGLPFLQGRLTSTWQFLVAHPHTLATSAVPYVIAGAFLGWVLAGRRQVAV